MHTKTSNQSSKAWRAIAAFCVLVMLTLLPTSSFATVKSFRVANKNNTNVTHQWTFEGSSPLNDKKGIANGQMWPLGSSPWLEDGYNGADSKGLRLGGGVNNAGTNGIITVNGNAAGNPNAVYLTTNYAFEIIFRADEANSSSPLLGGVDKLSWLLCARSDDNTRRGYFLFQGEIGTLAGNGSGLGSIIGSSFGNIANGNRVATSLVAGHWYYVAGSYDTDLTAGTTTQTHYIADLTAGETTLTVVGPVTTPPGSTAPNNESVRFGIGTRYDGFGTTSQFNVEQVDLYTSNKMDQAHFQAQLTELLKAPHEVAIGGELIVDLNINRGLMLDINPIGGLSNGAYYWTNYGTAGGEFQSLRNPPFQVGRTNPLTYQVSGGTNTVYTVGGQGFESTFTMPTTISGQSAGVGKPYTAEVWFWPNRWRTIMDRVLCFGTDPTASAACIIGYGNGRGMENGGGAGIVPWAGQSAANDQLWYHMVNTYDGTTSILYTNGVEMGRNTINLNIADNRKMLLGSGNQGDLNYNNTVISAIGGFMAARVHSQALTPAQVLNNFQVGDQLPVINITVQNLAVTAVDIHTATVNGDLTVTTDPSTTELTVYYGTVDQGSSKVGWEGSVTLGAPQNVGAFSIPLSGLTDNVTYKCRIYGQNDNGEGWSGLQSFTTPPQAPAILNVSSRGQPNAVFVTWDRPMNATAINYENYELNGPLIFSATFSSGNTEVKLITETLTEQTYALTANNSQDLALGLPVVPNTQKTFTHGAGYEVQAPITMKRYDGINGTAVANLTGAGDYPNSPTSINTTLTQMRIPQDVADNYGWWMYGYFVAPESGNYNFHTASDDASQVWITVGGVRTKVSEETGCCGGPKPTITPVNLVAGQAYLLEQLGKEGGGGDHGWVSVMSPNNLFGYLGDGNGASLAIPSSAFAQTRIGSGTPFSTLGLVFFPLPPSNHVSLENVDYTFAATLDGTPPYSTPQWFRDGVLIPGATSLSYTAAAIPANNGAVYTLMVTGVCNTASASATFTVLSDTFPPTLVSATPGPLIGGNYVDILFSEAVETGSATESLNYEINGGALNVISATQLAPNKIRLTTDAQTRGVSYAVVVNSVVDLFANTIAANSTVYFNGANFPGGVAPVVWFDASQITGLNDNDTVNTWNDSSGNNYTASGANGQRTYVTGQLNGHPVVQLRGDGFFNLTGNLLAREQYVVVRLPGGGDWGSYLGSDIRSGYMARQDGRFWNENYPDGVKQNGVNFAGAQNEGITLPNPASYMILKITGSTRNNGATARTGWHIGKQEGWQSLNMDLAEILAFDRPLSLAEEARVSKSLGNKYGIALSYTDVLEVGSRGIATTVYVSYLDPMDSVTAGDAGNYELNGPLVLGATVIDSTTVRLDVEAMADGSTHTLTITGVRKASPGNPFIAPNPSVVSFQNNFPPGGVSLGMVAWFDASRITGLADGNNVATWNDSSGNNRHASRGNGTITYSVNQVNGKPSVIFRGDPWMDLGGSSMRAHEQYIVFRTPNQGDWGAMLGSQVRGEYMMRRDGKFWDQNTPAQVKQNGVQLSNITADNATPNIGTYMIMKIKGNNNFTEDRGGWKLGKQEGWQSLDMDLAEIVAFNRELSFVEEAKVSAALGAKYGIGTPDYADVLTVSSRGNPNAVYVSYLDAMDPATAGDPGNYDLGAGPLVLGATMLDATTVRLTVETMPDTYQTYTLNINGVKNATLAYISPNPTAKQFTHGKGYENYGLTLKRYMNIGGVSVSDLTGNANFPGNPTDTSYPINMEIPRDAADNYGWWMSGLYIAPATGNYVFHTSSDDGSQVWLSTDENPANKVKVSEQGGWNGSREYQGGATVSLVQGQKYYLEMLGKEGGGGDNGAVAAETPGNIYGYNGNGSEPIPATAFYSAGHRYGGVPFVTLGDVFFAVQPTNATVVDGDPLQMISVVDGTPPYLFQWKTNGVSIPGATNATYATLANNGLQGVQFSVCVSNEFSGTCSTNATISVSADVIRPTVVRVIGYGNKVRITFSEPMHSSAGELVQYDSAELSILSAVILNPTTIELTTSPQVNGNTYHVDIFGVTDTSLNLINPDPTHATFTTAPAPGGVLDGIVAWFDASTITGVADGGTVTTWTDISSFARPAVRQNGLVTYAANQMGCLPTVKFRNDAWSDIGGPDFFSKEQYIVFRTVDNGDWGSVLGSQSRSGYMLNRNGHFWGDNYPQGVRRNGEAPLSPNFQLPNNGRDFMVLKITGNSSDSNPRGGWKLGKQEGWQSLGMDLAEVIAYNRVLTVDEENAVGAYLTKKYKLNTAYAALPPDALVNSATIPALGNGIIVCRNITIGVPYGTDTSSLAPEFTLSDGATIAPLSGTTRNFTTPQHYIVTSSDSQVVNDYTVTVVVAPAPPGGVSAGLVAWFDASLIPGVNPGGSVGIWPDQSGNSRDASIGGGTMTLAGNQVNGRPAVVFRGNAFAPLAGSNMRAHEQYIVFRFPNSGDWGSFLGSESQAEYMIRRDGMFWNGNIPAGVKQNGVVFPNPTENNFLSNIGQYMILKITGNNNDVNDRGNWRLGRQQGWHSLDMDVAEIIAYNRELNGTEEAAIGSYLLCKYGINATYPDPCPPTLLSAAASCDLTQVSVNFSEPMTAATTAELLNYTITNSSGASITINSAAMNGTKGVTLTLASPLPVNVGYVVVVNGPTDLAGNPVAANSTAAFTAVTCTEIAGSLFREIYEGIGGNNINDLWNNGNYQANNPTSYGFLTEFNSPDRGDNYGIRVTGHLIPNITGLYRFLLHSDDQGRIFLSTDAERANATLLVEENGCCGQIESPDRMLVAGQAYYIEGFMKEGGGGDRLELRWRTADNQVPSWTMIPSGNLAYRYSLSINQNPVDQTVLPGNNVTFTVGASAGFAAIAIKYQWQQSVDYGASFQTIPGATSASYVRLVGGGDNNSQYRCEVRLLGNFQTNVSAAAILNPFPDTTPPTLLSAEGEAGGTTVLLTFDEGVTVGSAEELLNYSIVSAAGCELSVSAALRESPTKVRLTTAAQTPGAHYVVHVSHVQDLSSNNNEITPDSTASFTGKVLPAGTVIYYSFNADGSDGSGNNSHLVTENGNPQFVAQGRFGGGLYLDGNSTLRKVGFPTGVPTGGNPYTVAFFTKAESGVCGNGGWIGYGQANNGNLANNFRLNGINSIWNYWYGNDRGATLPAGNFEADWHSVVGTWDGSNRKLYLDGVLLDDVGGAGLNVIADQFVVGRTLNDCNFKGWIDEMLIVNRAMTQGEITAFNASGAGAVPDTTVPVIACNTNRAVTTPNPGGTAVSFSTTATDNSGCAAVVCVPASGSVFAVGLTTVNCHAYDANLNTNTCSFTVTVTLSVPPVPTTVTDVSFSGGTFNLSFTTVNGLTYYVEYAETFDGSVNGQGVAWTTVQTINGDGQVHAVQHTPAGGTKGYYRVRTQ